ncbi:MAG: hypothetical protein ACR2PT_03200 [Endozoicomonas sp.]
MGRIRTVKPELFIHDELYDAESESGLPVIRAFIGLFTIADRKGRFIWKPRQLKTQVCPYDPIDFSGVLTVLKTSGFITRYQVDGKEYGVINSFTEHQQINAKEAESKLPAKEDGEEILEVHPSRERSSPVKVIPMNSCELTSPVQGKHRNSHGEGKGRERNKELEGNKEQEGDNNTVASGDAHCRADAQQSPGDHEGDAKDQIPIDGELLEPEPPPDKKPKASANQVRDVFAFWQTTMEHPQARLDDKRKGHIRQALKMGYSVDDLKSAILGCSLTPHNIGFNERNQRYDGLHLILRSADQIDRFIRNSKSPPLQNRQTVQDKLTDYSTQEWAERKKAELRVREQEGDHAGF